MKKLLFVLLITPFFCNCQALAIQEGDSIYYPYREHKEFKYIRALDSVYSIKYSKLLSELENFKWNYRKIPKTKLISYKNVISTNYWINTLSKFVFENDNLSFITENNFYEFRRTFNREKSLFIKVYLEPKVYNKLNFIEFSINGEKYICLKKDNFITATKYFKKEEHFLRITIYYEKNEMKVVEIREFDKTFGRDMTYNWYAYFKDGKLIFEGSYNTHTVEGFSIDSKFKKEDFIKLSQDIYKLSKKD